MEREPKNKKCNGDRRDRTGDQWLIRPTLYRLSYATYEHYQNHHLIYGFGSEYTVYLHSYSFIALLHELILSIFTSTHSLGFGSRQPEHFH